VSVFELLIKKIIEISASLLILATLMFFLLKALPGGPFDQDAVLHPLVLQNLERHWQVHESSGAQWGSYILAAAQGDLGVSMIKPDASVVGLIEHGLRQTLTLNLMAVVFIFSSAFVLALVAVRFRGSTEEVIDQLMLAFISLPSLYLGPFLIYIFCFYLNLLPVAFLSSPAHYILPLLTLTLRPTAYLVRLLKSSLIENTTQDFARTAKAKGLSPTRILFKHLLRNSLIPVLSYSGPLMASLISGSFVVEVLFAVPGLGTEFVQSLAERDLTVITGLTLFYGTLLILLNQLMDFLMMLADPRIRGLR
jgi:oligopeptide transport system permease protein